MEGLENIVQKFWGKILIDSSAKKQQNTDTNRNDIVKHISKYGSHNWTSIPRKVAHTEVIIIMGVFDTYQEVKVFKLLVIVVIIISYSCP